MLFRRRKILLAVFSLLLLSLAGFCSWVELTYGSYGFHTLLRRGGTYWVTMKTDDPRLSPSMQLALTTPPPQATPGPTRWRMAEKGFEVAEMPVMAGGQQVDRILLNRIDPAYFRFVARNAPDGDKGIDEWERALPASVLIVNGSYYGRHGTPDTPIISEGIAAGPQIYDAKAGAFIANDATADIKDLRQQSWQSALAGATNAMLSYPLLIGEDGQTHVATTSRWLANRTFIGRDGDGRIIIGTTEQAFFTLAHLAVFLKDAPLNLKIALNFDGGPIACQSVRLTTFHRKFYATWEAQVEGDNVRLLRWPIPKATWAMPMVLTVERK